MRKILELSTAELHPSPIAVLRQMGVPEEAAAVSKHEASAKEALKLFSDLAVARGVVEDVGKEAFAEIFSGEGLNAEKTPLEDVFPRAERLALFVVTLGQPVCDVIRTRFGSGDYVIASMLDAAASLAADKAAELAESTLDAPGLLALRYSPGYCGWHVSGQRKLFAALKPAETGVRLRDSCLMEPLKSVSGVIVRGEPGIHEFENAFPFCRDCRHQSCQDRGKALKASQA